MDTFTGISRPTLRGLELRSMVVVVLLESGRPMTLASLASRIGRAGFELGETPTKAIADALRWEVRRGRAVRVGRGVYAAGTVWPR